jgi:hypothetical protein
MSASSWLPLRHHAQLPVQQSVPHPEGENGSVIPRPKREPRSPPPRLRSGECQNAVGDACKTLLHVLLRPLRYFDEASLETNRNWCSLGTSIDEGDNCATRFMSSCVLLLINWHDWGTLSACATPVREGVSCRPLKLPELSVLKPANSTWSRSQGRVRRSIGFDSQEQERDMPSNEATSCYTRHKHS